MPRPPNIPQSMIDQAMRNTANNPGRQQLIEGYGQAMADELAICSVWFAEQMHVAKVQEMDGIILCIEIGLRTFVGEDPWDAAQSILARITAHKNN